MIISVDEVKRIYEIVDEVKAELDEAQIPYKVPEQGIMIETPAAVMVSEDIRFPDRFPHPQHHGRSHRQFVQTHPQEFFRQLQIRSQLTAAVMAEQEYFKSALSDFTYEAASGGAIRHLADLGYTVKQISGQLSFPTPFARVQKTVWQRLLDTGVLLMEEPGSGQGLNRGKAGYHF